MLPINGQPAVSPVDSPASLVQRGNGNQTKVVIVEAQFGYDKVDIEKIDIEHGGPRQPRSPGRLDSAKEAMYWFCEGLRSTSYGIGESIYGLLNRYSTKQLAKGAMCIGGISTLGAGVAMTLLARGVEKTTPTSNVNVVANNVHGVANVHCDRLESSKRGPSTRYPMRLKVVHCDGGKSILSYGGDNGKECQSSALNMPENAVAHHILPEHSKNVQLSGEIIDVIQLNKKLETSTGECTYWIDDEGLGGVDAITCIPKPKSSVEIATEAVARAKKEFDNAKAKSNAENNDLANAKKDWDEISSISNSDLAVKVRKAYESKVPELHDAMQDIIRAEFDAMTDNDNLVDAVDVVIAEDEARFDLLKLEQMKVKKESEHLKGLSDGNILTIIKENRQAKLNLERDEAASAQEQLEKSQKKYEATEKWLKILKDLGVTT